MEESSNQALLSSRRYSFPVWEDRALIPALRSCGHKVMLVTRLCHCQPVSRQSVLVSWTVNRRQGADGWSSIRYYVGSTIGASTCSMHGQPKSGHSEELNGNAKSNSAVIRIKLSFPIPVCFANSLCKRSLVSRVALVTYNSFLCPRGLSIPTVCQSM